MDRQPGYTLLELLITLALIAVLAGIGVPAMRQLTRDAEMSGLVSTYLHAFNSARYNALAVHRPITMCALGEADSCTGKWGKQLALFYDDNRNGELERPEDLIEQVNVKVSDRIDISFRAFRTTRYVALRANGQYRQNGTFRFCPKGENPKGRAIVINVMGRARTEKITCPR